MHLFFLAMKPLLDWLFRRVVWLPQSGGGGGTAVMVGDGGEGITGLICFQKKVVNRGVARSRMERGITSDERRTRRMAR